MNAKKAKGIRRRMRTLIETDPEEVRYQENGEGTVRVAPSAGRALYQRTKKIINSMEHRKQANG